MPPRFSFNTDLITSSVNAPKVRWAKGKQEEKKTFGGRLVLFVLLRLKMLFGKPYFTFGLGRVKGRGRERESVWCN
jgi:hypothetical protein